ncbi:hypothetical protein EDD34_1571 [Myceligenerans xiligouense]|uniref:Uncharacterized protein n=1 Tax=Myceligenerans xiligouense TaxID=253184 RepID=A0A3N4YJN9_9MICO|nr:hypothetical protein EDD34_1571 [Myceligenerans xiligouense]
MGEENVVGEDNTVVEDVDGQVNTGDDAALAQVEEGSATQNTGSFTGIQSGDDTDVESGALGFGEGDVSGAQDVEVSDGGAFSTGGDATGSFTDTDVTQVEANTTTEITQVEANTTTTEIETTEIDTDIETTEIDTDIRADVDTAIENTEIRTDIDDSEIEIAG